MTSFFDKLLKTGMAMIKIAFSENTGLVVSKCKLLGCVIRMSSVPKSKKGGGF